VAYLTQVKEFYGLPIRVDPRVLIPRPETELLVERALQYLRTHPERNDVIDVGTGTGAIALAIASGAASARVIAIEADTAALQVARGNVRRLGKRRVRLRQGDLLAHVRAADLVVANLPYLSDRRRKQLSPDVQFEPKRALDGGADGLRLIRRLIEQAKGVIRAEGMLLLECDPEQVRRIRGMVLGSWPDSIVSVHDDLAGHPRVVEVAIR
jgi:release factor glutamine methyltransferase